MSVVLQYPYCDRNPTSGGLDLMPDLPIILRHQSNSLACVGLVDSGATISVLPYSMGVKLGFDWSTQQARIMLGGILANVDARGIVVEASVGQLSSVRLALAWVKSEEIPLLLGQFNFFQVFDICFFRARGVFEIRQAGIPAPP